MSSRDTHLASPDTAALSLLFLAFLGNSKWRQCDFQQMEYQLQL